MAGVDVLVYAIAAFFSWLVGNIFADPPDEPDLPDLDSGGHLSPRRTTDFALPLIYGTVRVGVNQVYIGCSDSANQYLNIIGVVGEGPVNGIHQEGGVDQVFLDDKIYTEYGGNVYYEFFTGTATQNVCATMHSAIPEWTDPLRYTAYIYMRIQFDEDQFNGIPDITVTVEGLKVWDPTDDVTAYSENFALHVYDMLTRPSTRGGFGLDVWNGPEPGTPRIDKGSVDDAKDYCTAKGWTGGMVMEGQTAAMDNIKLLLANFRGALVYSENTFKVLFRDLNYESVVMSFDDDEVVADALESSLKISQPNIFDRPNAVRGKYLSSSGATDGSGTFQVADLVKTDSSALTADGDYREAEVVLYGLNTVELVGKMLNYHLERRRWGNTVAFTAGGKAYALEPMDLIQLTHTMPGWTDHQLRVTGISYLENNTAGITAVEESLDLYDDTYDVTTHDWYQTSLPDILGAVPSVINVSHAEDVYYYRERSFTRWKIDFDPPAAATYPWWDYAEIWLSIGGTSDYRYMTKSTSDYVLDPVEEGEIYYVKIRSVSISGAKEDFDSCQTVYKTIQGKTSAPADLSAITAVAVNDTVNIFADEVSSPDVEGYEFRISGQGNANWVGAVYLAFNKKPIHSISGMRSGDFRVFCKPRGNNGVYADNAVYCDFTMLAPHGYTLDTTSNIDQGTGSHSNTQFYDQGGGDYVLRVNHASALTGTYTSAEIDLGSSKTVRVQGDFVLKVLDASATWAALWGASNQWNYKDMSDVWGDIFSPSAASSISAKLKWGTATGVYPNSAELFELSAIDAVGRYFQVEVTLTDPNNSQYLMLDGSGGNTVLTLKFYT